MTRLHNRCTRAAKAAELPNKSLANHLPLGQTTALRNLQRFYYSPAGALLAAAGAVYGLFLVSACVHTLLVVPVPLDVVVQWTIPLGMDDDARLCVASTLEAGVDPADVLPLRCVSIGAVRVWIRGQRWAE